jgi:hypothetical protein
MSRPFTLLLLLVVVVVVVVVSFGIDWASFILIRVNRIPLSCYISWNGSVVAILSAVNRHIESGRQVSDETRSSIAQLSRRLHAY